MTSKYDHSDQWLTVAQIRGNEMEPSLGLKGELSCLEKHKLCLQERVMIQWDVEGKGHLYFVNKLQYNIIVASFLGEEFLLDQHLTVESLLGSGAYGVVCEVIDQRNGSRHAVKVRNICIHL